MTNFEYYETRDKAVDKFLENKNEILFPNEDSILEFVDWLYKEHKDNSENMIKKFSDYFGLETYENFTDSPWYKRDPEKLSNSLYREANIVKCPYDTACRETVIISIMKLLISKDKDCNEYGIKAANDMMRKYDPDHSGDRKLKCEYICFIHGLHVFFKDHIAELTYVEQEIKEQYHDYCFYFTRLYSNCSDSHHLPINITGKNLEDARKKFNEYAYESEKKMKDSGLIGIELEKIEEDGNVIRIYRGNFDNVDEPDIKKVYTVQYSWYNDCLNIVHDEEDYPDLKTAKKAYLDIKKNKPGLSEASIIERWI